MVTRHVRLDSEDAAQESHAGKVLSAVVKAKRVVVVCGAGISVHAGIPDFRSEDGLFKSLKKEHATLSSGKDLFDASVFKSETTSSLFLQMMAELSSLSVDAQPTVSKKITEHEQVLSPFQPFHNLLRLLDDQGKLLRVYTQNIDALESKSGLTFGVPPLKQKSPRKKRKVDIEEPVILTPRCIPLHGTLETMHCPLCLHKYPLVDHMSDLRSGKAPFCSECTSLEETRQFVGKRPRGVGKLRPSVVLYNEAHKDGEGVGEVVHKDLTSGRGADLLLVVGTSLKVPGTKRIVREFSKAINAKAQAALENASPTKKPVNPDDIIKCVYLNLEFPTPAREWDGVFDVWLQGDAQAFAQTGLDALLKDAALKEARRQRRELSSSNNNNSQPIEPPIPVEDPFIYCSPLYTDQALASL